MRNAMRTCNLVLCGVLLAGCPELVSVDDPRTIGTGPGSGGSSADKGLCTGSPVFCDDRSQAQCNSGCGLQAMCHSPDLERCAAYRNPDQCDADTACYWSTDTCHVERGGACGIYQSQTACFDEPLHECIWGTACDGSATYCFELKTAAACTANLGCAWKPG